MATASPPVLTILPFRTVAKPSTTPVRTNPFVTYRDPQSGRWLVQCAQSVPSPSAGTAEPISVPTAAPLNGSPTPKH